MTTPKSRTAVLGPAVGAHALPGASTGFLTDEFLYELRHKPGAKKYREMADNDPVLGAILFAMTQLVRQVEWRAEPANDSGKAKEAAEWLNDCLLKHMTHPFQDAVENACAMFEFGYAPLEVVYKRLEDNTVGVRSLELRSPESVWRWSFDDEGRGSWNGFEQLRMDGAGDPVFIPRARLLLFRTTAKRDNPEGRSLLRNCFVPYQRKRLLEIAEGRLLTRAAGVVVLYIPDELLDPQASSDKVAARQQYEALMDNLSQDRQAGILLPSSAWEKGGRRYEFQYVLADSARATQIDPAVTRYDQRMAASLLADFILLGSGSKTGSWALSSDKTDLFSLAVNGYLKTMAAEFETLVKRLWKLNGFNDDVRPTWTYGDIETSDLAALGGFVSALAGAGAALFPNDRLLAALLEQAKLPVPTPEESAKAQEAAQQQQGDPYADEGEGETVPTYDEGEE